MFAPAKTPPDVIERLNKAIVTAVESPDVRERMLGFGAGADRHLGRRASPRSRSAMPRSGRRR